MSANAELLKALGPELELLLPELDEKARRLVLGAVARAAGDGGIGAVARLTGASWQTVADGAAELGSGQTAPPGRVRRAGAGRRAGGGGAAWGWGQTAPPGGVGRAGRGRPGLAVADPGLGPALLALVE